MLPTISFRVNITCLVDHWDYGCDNYQFFTYLKRQYVVHMINFFWCGSLCMKETHKLFWNWICLAACFVLNFTSTLFICISGFLPDEWDKLFVKYLYPSFTPTVLLFIAGTTAYGVIKYLQNEELKGQKWSLLSIEKNFKVHEEAIQ